MKIGKTDEKGFTLIEVIVTLVLVAITAAMAGMWIVSVANGYIFAKVNAKTAQNAQLAMTRLVKEFTSMIEVDEPNTNDSKISYIRTNSPAFGLVSVKVWQDGAELKLQVNNGDQNTLTDSVSAFSLAYCDTDNVCVNTWGPTSRIIEIKLTLTGGNNTPVTFVRRVAPRNL